MSGCFVRMAFCGVFVVPYACIPKEWVLLTHCFWRSAPYAMSLMFVFEMSGCFVRTVSYALLFTLASQMSGCFWCTVHAHRTRPTCINRGSAVASHYDQMVGRNIERFCLMNGVVGVCGLHCCDGSHGSVYLQGTLRCSKCRIKNEVAVFTQPVAASVVSIIRGLVLLLT